MTESPRPEPFLASEPERKGRLSSVNWRPKARFDVRDFYADRDVYALVRSMALAHENSARIRERIRESSADLRRRVESELDE